MLGGTVIGPLLGRTDSRKFGWAVHIMLIGAVCIFVRKYLKKRLASSRRRWKENIDGAG
jgi:hypothetical protein